jgi:hypothetical protein
MRMFKIIIILVLFLISGVPLAFADSGYNRVLSVEAGYDYITSAKGLNPDSPHGIMTSIYHGYVIHDKPKSMSVLSLVLGYELFPRAAGSALLHNVVYGAEYSHTFFRHMPVSLLLDYGLLFNLIMQSDREGYAFGHHTRLGFGSIINVSKQHKVALKASYNIVTFPYFETASTRISYPSVSVRYYWLH